MKKNFTKLVCAGIACFCMVCAMPQERMAASSKVTGTNINQDEVNLRADEVEYWWPDSVIMYNAEGIAFYSQYYDEDNRILRTIYDGNENFYPSNGYSFDGQTKIRFEIVDGEIRLHYPRIMATWYYWFMGIEKYNTVFDGMGNLILLELKGVFANGTDNYNEFRIKYNEKNKPILIEQYNYNMLKKIIQYEYNENGHMTLCESHSNDGQNNLITDSDFKETVEFDEKGKPISVYRFIGNNSLNTWTLLDYYIFYYSDGTSKNEQIESNELTAYLIDQTLYIQSEKADRISIYSITGMKLYEIGIQPGMNTIPASHFPQGILIVKGSTGWVVKIVNKK